VHYKPYLIGWSLGYRGFVAIRQARAWDLTGKIDQIYDSSAYNQLYYADRFFEVSLISQGFEL